jgi:hypothetical protein
MKKRSVRNQLGCLLHVVSGATAIIVCPVFSLSLNAEIQHRATNVFGTTLPTAPTLTVTGVTLGLCILGLLFLPRQVPKNDGD